MFINHHLFRQALAPGRTDIIRPRTSSMADRVIRVSTAALTNPREMPGSRRDCNDLRGWLSQGSNPPAGNHWRVTANKRIRRRPAQKAGTARPI